MKLIFYKIHYSSLSPGPATVKDGGKPSCELVELNYTQ